jgi:hypothetical protein
MLRVPASFAVLALVLAPGLPGRAAVPETNGRPPLADCTAEAPPAGASLSGTVLQVVDGQTVCVALGATPDQWVRVRLVGAEADASRGALLAATFGKAIDCRMHAPDAAGDTAECALDGVAVTKLLRDPAVKLQAADWR